MRSADRTIDQMVQAARSGKQNIIEGAKASVTSRETELKLTNVARASLEELLEDFRDFLRTSQSGCWDKNSREALYMRRLGAANGLKYERIREICETRSAPIVANIAICLIHQTNYLLDRYLACLETDFVKNGGIRERMGQARREYRENRKAKEKGS